MFNAQLPWQLKRLSYPETGWIRDSRLDKASHAKHPFFPLSCLLCFPGWRTDRNPERGEAAYVGDSRAFLHTLLWKSRYTSAWLPQKAWWGLLWHVDSRQPRGASLCGSFPRPPGRFLTAPTSPTHSLWTTFRPLSPGLMLHLFHFFSPGLFPMLLTMPRTLALCSYQI